MNLKLDHADYVGNITVLAVAYHNVGIENEYIGHYKVALDWYKRAHFFLEKHGHGQH